MIVIVLPDIPAEDRLLANARQGDQAAIMEIYESYFPPIYQFLRLRVGNKDEAEDLASEVFLKFVSAVRGHSAPRVSLRGWLFRVARNELHAHYGKNLHFPTTTLDEWMPAASETDPEIQLIHNLSVERSRYALRMLVPDQQEVLILRFGQALNLQETADIMGKSVSAVKSLQFRAVDTLRQIVGQMNVEIDHG